MQNINSIPNIISILRIILSLALLPAIDTGAAFAVLVLLVGVSDIADGYLARKYDMATEKGARLDSTADLFFFSVVMIVLFLKYEWIITSNLSLLVSVLILKALTAVTSKIKYGRIDFIHSIANKITGALVFFSVLIIPFGLNEYLIKGVFLIAIFSAAEELGIQLLNKELNPNKKSIFAK